MEQRELDTLGLLRTLAETVNVAVDYQTALQSALGAICHATQWPYGEVWVPTGSAGVLVCETTWCADDRGMRLADSARRVEFPPGRGLPGRVSSQRQSIWHPDVAVLPVEEFVRCHEAAELGLRAGLGVPVVVSGDVAAVFTFFLPEPRQADWDLAESVSLAAAQLGMLLVRGRLEERLQAAVDNLDAAAVRAASIRDSPGSSGARLRLLGDLQDEVVQHLFALGLEFQALAGRTTGEQPSNGAIVEGIARINRLISETRDYASALMAAEPVPAESDLARGLSAMLRRRVPGTVATALDTGARPAMLDEITAGNLLLIAREAIDNAVTHASCSRIGVRLQDDANGTTLMICDDGSGFSVSAAHEGVGIRTMHAAAFRLGGTVTIRSAPAAGTIVTAFVPSAPGHT